MPTKRKKRRLHRRSSADSLRVRILLLTGQDFEFLDYDAPAPDAESLRAAWQAHREDLIAEHQAENGPDSMPWGWHQFEAKGTHAPEPLLKIGTS